MKKNVKVYSASDFVSANASVLIDTCYWTIDTIDYTSVGQYSQTPLFELELKQIVSGSSDVPEGFEDASAEMTPNRTYFVREGRPLYNTLVEMWMAADGDKDDFVNYVMKKYAKSAFRGRVERLTGVIYSKDTKSGAIQKSRMEAWYPESMDSPRIMDDFLYLCNKGVYKPVVEEKKEEDAAKLLAGLDPEALKALVAALKK